MSTNWNDPSRLYAEYLAGRMVRPEVPTRILLNLTLENVEAMLSSCPEIVREWLREESNRLPADGSDDWSNLISVQSYCGPELSKDEWKEIKKDRSLRYQEGVRVFRIYDRLSQ